MKIFRRVVNKEVQMLRGLAVTLVVLYHLDPNIFGLGYLGVNVFFVISGFIVHEKLLAINERKSLYDSFHGLMAFFSRRITRIFPSLSLMIIIASVLLAVLIPLGKSQAKSLLLGVSALFGVSNFFAEKFAGDYFNPSPNIFLHTWSLGVEVQFYLFFGILVFLIHILCGMSYARSRTLYLICLLFLSITSLSQFLNIQDGLDNQKVGYLMSYHAWEFILGIFAREFILRQKHKQEIFITTLFTSLISAVAILCILIPVTKYQIIHLTVVLATALILALEIRTNKAENLSNLLHLVGNRSYSIYLWHFPLFVLSKHSPATGISFDNRIVPSLIAILVTCILSELSYRYVEEKLR